MGILELIETGVTRDEAWLREALQAAVELEFFTIPPYLIAMWSIKDEASDAARTIREVVYEEMQHMALACNMLVAIGGTPRINREPAIPVYPRPMPGGVRPDLIIGLSGLTPEVVRTFMQVERPENPLIFQQADGLEALGESFTTIGAFYEAIRTTFHSLTGLKLSVDRQVSGPLAPLVIADLPSVDRAIDQIRVQGEGSDVTPLADDAAKVGTPVAAITAAVGGVGSSPTRSRAVPDLAHYYRFQELDKGQKLIYQEKTGDFRWAGPLPFPEVYPVAPIPAGGYRDGDVPPAVAADLRAFDAAYTHMLDELQGAWESGGQGALWRAVEWMFSLRDRARALMETRIPGTAREDPETGAPIAGSELTYGPCFRYLAKSTG